MCASVVISGSGLWKPAEVVTNEELVTVYNAYACGFNEANRDAIANRSVAEKPLSSAEFIEKASGIKQRYVYTKEGILDAERMRPLLAPRADDELSHQAEMAVAAARRALTAANKTPADIDMVIVSCAYTQQPTRPSRSRCKQSSASTDLASTCWWLVPRRPSPCIEHTMLSLLVPLGACW